MDIKDLLDTLKKRHDMTVVPEEAKLCARAYSLFSIDAMTEKSRQDVWMRFVNGIERLSLYLSPLLAPLRKSSIPSPVKAIDWSQTYYLTTDVRPTLTILAADDVAPPTFGNPGISAENVVRFKRWIDAVMWVTNLVSQLEINESERIELVSFWSPKGWYGLLSPEGSLEVERLLDRRKSPRNAKVVWSEISDVPVTYTSPDNFAQISPNVEVTESAYRHIVPDPFLVRRFVETELEQHIRKDGWRNDNVEAGAITFLTGFKRFLSAPYVDGETIVNLFYNIYNGDILFDSCAYPLKKDASPKFSVYNLIQRLIADGRKDVLEPGKNVFTPNTACLARLLLDSGCLPMSRQDYTHHERMHGWFAMKRIVEDEVMRLRGITGPSEIIQMQIPIRMSAFSLTWDKYFHRILGDN